jgi:hypothetical protein
MNCIAQSAAVRNRQTVVRALVAVLWSASAAVVTAQETTTSHVGNGVMHPIHTVGILEVPALNIGQFGAPTPDWQVDAAEARPRTPYSHAYYLFLDGAPKGCELCYVPLLITHHSLDDVDKSKGTTHGVWIVTYERDSIWELKEAAPIDPSAIDASRRVVHVGSRSYRYQEIGPREVLKLLENPLGTIPISRPGLLPKTVPGASLNELIADFRALLPAGPSLAASCKGFRSASPWASDHG